MRQDLVVPSESERGDEGARASGIERIRETARRTDGSTQLVTTARFIRKLLPGGEHAQDDPLAANADLPESLGRLVSRVQPERPSAVHELGLGVLQAWKALSESQRRRQGQADVAILFTDLVGFSSWALDVGDEAALELLKQVAKAESASVEANAGIVVKRLGDGSMAVFGGAADAVMAALESQRAMAQISVEGHTPRLRAGVHRGRPRKVGEDFLGVDVNIAARVADAAGAGEVLVSDSAREDLDSETVSFGRRRRLKAPGAPRELSVYRVRGLAA
jgi:adenylate cyclase